uniref:Ig-like domain-containing protein n=1 Tax=Denticeps clupeoides TaxID=299321 RepID=A0AAY4BAI7_9TELE
KSRNMSLIIKRDDKNVSEGENATLSCILTDTNEELMQVIWYRRTIMRQSVEHIYTIFQKSHFANDDVNGLKERLTFTGNVAEGIASLYLTNVTLFDDGVYTCTFILDHSGPVSSTIKLDHPTLRNPQNVSCRLNVECECEQIKK